LLAKYVYEGIYCYTDSEQMHGNDFDLEIPNMYIYLEPEQGVRALSMSTSWTLFDENGNAIMGMTNLSQ